MSEVTGLAAIVRDMEERGATITGLTLPPDRDDFPTKWDYDEAHAAWQRRLYRRGSVRPIP